MPQETMNWTNNDGSLNRNYFATDNLHLNSKGYNYLAKSVLHHVAEIHHKKSHHQKCTSSLIYRNKLCFVYKEEEFPPLPKVDETVVTPKITKLHNHHVSSLPKLHSKYIAMLI